MQVVIVTGGSAVRLSRSWLRPDPADGKCTQGIGLQVVEQLAKHGAKGTHASFSRVLVILSYRSIAVYMAARSEEKSNEAIKQIESKDEKVKGKVHWLKLDLMSIKGCHQAAKDFLGKEKALHLLFNNACARSLAGSAASADSPGLLQRDHGGSVQADRRQDRESDCE